MSAKIPVAVLAATGSVGQRFVSLLDGHPFFEVTALTASDRSVGRPYGEACRWLLAEPMPAWARGLTVLPTTPENLGVQIAFSALPADVAREVEPCFAQAGIWVCSNASAFRREEDVPLLLPEVNPEHIELLTFQQQRRGWSGGILTNPNCASTGLTVALKALQQSFGLKRVLVATLQAASGAGYPGVPSMDLLDNLVPYIPGEEEKLEWEARKMLGQFTPEGVRYDEVALSAQVNRVPVVDGHTACVWLETTQPASPEQAAAALRAYRAPALAADLPFTPRPPLLVREEADRPQPRLDRNSGGGMTTVVGRVRADALLGLRMVILSHNTIRGAAGGSIYNAELLVKTGRVKLPLSGAVSML
ncbi:MAG TPA: aspartate-semialdehyde dehydrogenase [Anaerolineaceae bacterium]|nr:aspartate-semialdehyde dehydrogenase [Anaerolineaceae bacterium]HPN51449.1 aspartate-semialdehyde dehydrogenase [Anaerolineaceae bacterium]